MYCSTTAYHRHIIIMIIITIFYDVTVETVLTMGVPQTSLKKSEYNLQKEVKKIIF